MFNGSPGLGSEALAGSAHHLLCSSKGRSPLPGSAGPGASESGLVRAQGLGKWALLPRLATDR
jgi:hypothetical protein